MSWAALCAAAMLVAAWLGQTGGVRFDADPGVCEPGDTMVLSRVGAATVSDSHPAAQPTALPWPVRVTCRREIGGLPPGMYRVTITAAGARLPPRGVVFRIDSGTWTTVRLAFPPVVVRGRVLSHGEPVAGVVVQFSGSGCSRASLPTNNEGAYIAELCEAGEYKQSLRPVMARPLPPVPEAVSLVLGDNLHDLDVGGGRLRVWFTERGLPITRATTVQLMLQSLPHPAVTQVITKFDEPIELPTLAPGRYTVWATSGARTRDGVVPELTSDRSHDIAISPQLPVELTIDLVPKEAWLMVVDPAGVPVEGAQVFPAPMSTSIRSDAEGRVSLAGLSTGLRVVIRTRTWGMSCHTVTADSLQRAVVQEAPDESVVVWRTGPPDKVPPLPSPGQSPLAGSTVGGLPGAGCAIPYEAFPVATARVRGGVVHFFRLPRGSYMLTLKDGTVLAIQAPGRVEIK